jgi:sigma-B regulation protein RsbU (phosphoserine phosphatase)
MRIFYFLAKNISYTFAVTFFLSIFGLIEGLFSFVIASSFVMTSYSKIVKIFLQWLPPVFIAVIFLFYIASGFLMPVKIPAMLKRHRRINNIFRKDLKADPDSLKETYGDFSDLVMNNTTASVVFVLLTSLAMTAICYLKFSLYGELTLPEFEITLRIILLATVISMIVFGMTTHLLSEYLTNNERAELYNEILKKGEMIKPHVLFSVRVNFNFFVFIMVIILFMYAALFERIKAFGSNNYIIVIFLLFAVLSALFLARVNANSILRILNDMARVTREIAAGKRSGFKVLSTGKEFSSIEYALMEMAWEIDEHRKNLELKVQERTEELEKVLNDLKIKDDQIQKQLDMASVIQRSILLTKIDDWNELKFSVKYNAMEKIGGDFYDVFQLKDNKIGILIADVSGHGIPAALVTAMAKISFGNAGYQSDSPKRIFQDVNKNIIDHMKTQDYMTCFMAVIDDDYNVTYSNASHQKALIFRKETGRVEQLDTNGLFIGALEEARDTYEEKTTKLNYGDRLILYTDGIPEAQSKNREEYTNERFENSIKAHKDLNLDEFTDAVLRDVLNHIGEMGAIDDITLLIVELVLDEAIDIVKSSKRLVNNHKYLDSIELLENGLEKYPDNQKILYNLGKNYFRVNNYNKAVQILDRYIRKDKKNKFAFYVNGASHYQMMDFKSAIENFISAIQIDPNMSNALFALGMSYKNLGDYDTAVQTFERVINIDADNKMALFEIKQIEKLKSGTSA